MRMTANEDYLMRIIHEMMRMLLKTAGLKSAGRLDEALAEVDEATDLLLGPAGKVVALLDPVSAAQIVGDPDRLLMWARLLAESAEIHDLQGNRGEATEVRLRAQALAHEAVRRGVSDATGTEVLFTEMIRTGEAEPTAL